MPFIVFAFFFSSNVIANAPFPAVVIPVATPFESEGAKRIRNLALEALDKFILETKGVPAAERTVFKLIIDFNPQGKTFTSEFGPAYDLAQSLRLLKNRGSLTILVGCMAKCKGMACFLCLPAIIFITLKMRWWAEW